MSMADDLKRRGGFFSPGKQDKKGQSRSDPLWKGPEIDGVTFSLLSRFLVCRERFRLYVVEGLAPSDGFNHRIEYGVMWHLCEEAYASPDKGPACKFWEVELKRYCQDLCGRYPTQQEQVQHWFQVCRTQFPIYVDYWLKQKELKERTPLLQEQVFDVPYSLPSGRVIRLRGKWDSVFRLR